VMNLDEILAEYDAMFGKNSLEEIEQFLTEQIAKAKLHREQGILVTLLNEVIGFCRDTTQKDKALQYCKELLALLDEMQLEGSVSYATSLLNIANAYRAFGLLEQSLKFYEKVQRIYSRNLASNDFNYASLYNNWSLLYQEMQEYENAAEMLRKALKIVDSYENAVIPQATTKTNLAATLLQIGTESSYAEAMKLLQDALAVFEADGGKDFHYGAALVAMGDACSYQKKYNEAASYYEMGLQEIEKHTGKNDNYGRVMEKYAYAKECAEKFLKESSGIDILEWSTNLERCHTFYKQYGRQMLRENFPDYADRIAVGMVGEGSDCFGFDDEISSDHDYGVGFCMWVTSSDFSKIGDRLQSAYEKLVDKVAFDGSVDKFLQGRRGVFSINEFYNRLLGTNVDYESGWLSEQENIQRLLGTVEEFRLAQAVNGAVFEDTFGVFTTVRRHLGKYYPEDVWRSKIAQSMHDFSQYAQSNYARMMTRGDGLTALVCVGKACEATMDLAYLLERKYAPYYKWKRKGLEQIAVGDTKLPGVKFTASAESSGGRGSVVPVLLALLGKVSQVLPQTESWKGVKYSAMNINTKDEYVLLFEQLAAVLLNGLVARDIVKPMEIPGQPGVVETFLESYIPQVLGGKRQDVSVGTATENLGETVAEKVIDKESKMQKIELVDKIVELEWKQFDKVKNEGGRADCQDNWGTFSIMRKSQYLAWTEELLESFYGDLLTADAKGWNLIMEKYARMMQSTAPEKYAELEKELPVLNEDRIAIQEAIIKIQVSWMEDFATKYPKMAGNARSIRTEEDSAYNTSYETYLRGEMSTYSENTFVLYGRFITVMLKEGRNLAYEIMKNTAELYGYESVEDAESKLE